MTNISKYDPEKMIPRLLELMSGGASIVEVCANLGISRPTFYAWLDDEGKKEFKEAFEAGELLSQAWWEREGRIALRDREFNSSLWYMNMKNRFNWADKQELMGKNGGAIETREIGEEEADKRLKELLVKIGKA